VSNTIKYSESEKTTGPSSNTDSDSKRGVYFRKYTTNMYLAFIISNLFCLNCCIYINIKWISSNKEF
jgi:hypothetical protein